jgi:hypothetical protein
MATGEWSSRRKPIRVRSPLSASHRQLVAQGVVLPGTHKDWIAPATVAALFAQFRKAGFFNLRSLYRAEITDGAAYVLTADAGQRHKSVEDYMGRLIGMPKVVTELEDAVDKVAGTVRWVRGTVGLNDERTACPVVPPDASVPY